MSRWLLAAVAPSLVIGKVKIEAFDSHGSLFFYLLVSQNQLEPHQFETV